MFNNIFHEDFFIHKTILYNFSGFTWKLTNFKQLQIE